MNFLIKDCTIIDPRSSHHNKKVDLLIEKGQISRVAKNLSSKKAKIIQGKKLMVSPGWMDIGVQTGEPGLEQRDRLKNTLDAAAAGGYTRVALFSNDAQPFDHSSGISFVQEKTKEHPVHCHVIGALSQKLQGTEISEMMDMHESGAIGFGDGLHPIKNTGLFERALQYSQSVNAPIIHQPEDPSLAKSAQMHEGEVSTSLGMKGIPDIAESIMIDRDLELLKYTGGKLLTHLVSTEKGLDHIKKEKKNLADQLFVSVSYQNLLETEEHLLSFDANRKLRPPLRSKSDCKALNKGVENDLIDIICSNHVPIEREGKLKEFVYAEGGALGLQTCGLSMLELFDPEVIAYKMAINPRKIFQLDPALIEKGERAELTIWSSKEDYLFTEQENHSKSRNSPFFGKNYKNKIVGVISQGTFVGE